MSATTRGHEGTTARKRGTATETHHSKEDAISERELVFLLEGARELDDYAAFEARFIIYAAGVLGMRAGEIAHFDTDWINWAGKQIEIPAHDECTKGVDGGVCGYCREMAERRLRSHNLSIEDAREEVREDLDDVELDSDDLDRLARARMQETNMAYQEAIDERWKPKTDNSVRAIPFDFDARLEIVVERFNERYDAFPRSKPTVNRRVTAALEASELDIRVYPHSLRATASGFHASRDVSEYALMSVMGWNDLQTARSYIQASDETAAKEIRSKHR